MAKTITGTIGTLVSLTLAADDPTTITVSGLLTAGLAGDASRAWEVVNEGTVDNSTGGTSGIRLLAGGTVSNAGGALINGANYGIRATGGGLTASNSGTIAGGNYGVYGYDGGSVTNLATGTISGGNAIYGGLGALTVANSGVVTGGTATARAGVRLRGGGQVTNLSAGTITGQYAVRGQSQPATVTNAGVMTGGAASGGRGVLLSAGGQVTNQATGTITGHYGIEGTTQATIVNAGTIVGAATGVGRGLLLGQGGVVTNQSGGSISGVIGIFGIYGGVSVTNAGTIQGGTTGVALRLDSGGSVTNQAGGTIAAYIGVTTGIGFSASIENAGRIAGGGGLSGYGLYLRDTATVTNLSGGHISGRYGIADRKQAATISNAGTIEGGTGSGERGVYLGKGGVVTNLAGGTISGTRGVVAAGAGATVRNAGTITGSTTAVGFGSGFASTLIVDAGAVFSGTVNGANTIGSTIASTMILASAASAGTISGLGSQFINFARTTIEAGADWTLTGVNTLVDQTTLTNNGTIAVTGALTADDLLGSGRVIVSGGGTITTTGTVAAGETIELGSGGNALVLNAAGFDATIAGFGTGETIALSGVTDALSAAIVGGNTLVVDRGANPDIELILDPGTDYTGASFTVGDAASDFITTDLACFAQGTRIDTPDGPVPVEALAIGRMVLTASGESVVVRWVGHRRLDVARHPDPALIRPIRIAPDAIAPSVPTRDVVLSPDHALAIDGHLIPVRLLANGMTIRGDDACRSVTYWHVELDRHDVLLSDGLPVESYLDTGNRAMFVNGGAPLVLHPDLAAGQAARVARSCLPFLDDPGQVHTIWAALADRARGLGYVAAEGETCDDPALMVAVDGRLIAPSSARDGVYAFVLPPFRDAPRLVSRAVRPSVARPWDGDRRRLGVMVRRVTLRRSGQAQEVPLDHPDLREGWWTLERDAGSSWRWTDGNAALPLAAGGAGVLEVRVGPALAYAVAA